MVISGTVNGQLDCKLRFLNTYFLKDKIKLTSILTFSAHTINCVCHSIRLMFRVLGIYDFESTKDLLDTKKCSDISIVVMSVKLEITIYSESFSQSRFLDQAKVIYPKYSKQWLSTVAHRIDCVCSKISNHGLNHGLLSSLFKFLG